jgi:phage anti-repressor protein
MLENLNFLEEWICEYLEEYKQIENDRYIRLDHLVDEVIDKYEYRKLEIADVMKALSTLSAEHLINYDNEKIFLKDTYVSIKF